MTQGSLFDGYGGLRRGLEDAGFQTRWALDILNGHDIAKLEPNDFERVDCISGGPPCQKGSQSATFQKGRTYETGWTYMLRFVEALKPGWVILENVRGFQRQMVDWTADLHKLGYGCAGQVIDSKHWVPQQRARAFVIGRLGAVGMDLWNLLYANRERMEGRQHDQTMDQARQRTEGRIFAGSCPDCVRGGIFARVSARRTALMGAGNGVTQPLARWLGQRILSAEEAMTDECIECHCPLEEGKGKRKNMCPECFEEMCRDDYYQRLLDERRDEGGRI